MAGLFDAQIAQEYIPVYNWGSSPIVLCPMSEWLLVGGSEESRAIHDKASSDALAFVKRCIKAHTPQELDRLYEWLFLTTEEEQRKAIKMHSLDGTIIRRLQEYARGNQIFRDYAQAIAQGS